MSAFTCVTVWLRLVAVSVWNIINLCFSQGFYSRPVRYTGSPLGVVALWNRPKNRPQGKSSPWWKTEHITLSPRNFSPGHKNLTVESRNAGVPLKICKPNGLVSDYDSNTKILHCWLNVSHNTTVYCIKTIIKTDSPFTLARKEKNTPPLTACMWVDCVWSSLEIGWG